MLLLVCIIFLSDHRSINIVAKTTMMLNAGNASRSASPKSCQFATTKLRSEKIKEENDKKPDSTKPSWNKRNAETKAPAEARNIVEKMARRFFTENNCSSSWIRAIIAPNSHVGGSGGLR